MAFKFRIPCFVIKKSKANFFGIEAIFFAIDKKLLHMSSKGVPISIAVLNFRGKSDENPTDSEMNLNNSMNI